MMARPMVGASGKSHAGVFRQVVLGLVLLAIALASASWSPARANPREATWDEGLIARDVAKAALVENRQFTYAPRAYRRFWRHTMRECEPVFRPGVFVGCEAPYRNGDVGYAGRAWFADGSSALVTGP